MYNRQNTGLDLGDALKSQVCPPMSWVALGKSLCLSWAHFLIFKMISSVSNIIDPWENKRSCVNAGEACGSDNPVFCPLHSSNISQLKVLALFTAYSVLICYGQAGEEENFFTYTQARNNKSSFKSSFSPHFTFGALRMNPHHHCRWKMKNPFLPHILELIQRSWCSKYGWFYSKYRFRWWWIGIERTRSPLEAYVCKNLPLVPQVQTQSI